MTRLWLGAVMSLVLVCRASAGTPPAYRCGSATVRDVRTISETVRETNVERQRLVHVVTVQLDDRAYTSKSEGDPFGTLDPTRLAVDESIGMCVSATQMILERPNGTDWRAPVVRIERAAARRGGTQ